jgi:hypothetical protein
MGSKSFSSTRRALETAEQFSNLFNTDAVSLRIVPPSFTDAQQIGERTEETFEITDREVFSDEEPIKRNTPAQNIRALFESAEKLTEDGGTFLSVSPNMPRWLQAWSGTTSLQIGHLVKRHAPKIVTFSDRGSGGNRVSARPNVADFLADCAICARRVLTPTQLTMWQQLVVVEKGKRLEQFASLHRLVYEAIARAVGNEFERCFLFPSRGYFETPTAIGKARRSSRLRHEQQERRQRRKVAA